MGRSFSTGLPHWMSCWPLPCTQINLLLPEAFAWACAYDESMEFEVLWMCPALGWEHIISLSGMNSSLLTASHASHLTNLQVDRMVSDFHLWGCRNSWENHSFGSFNVWRWDMRLWVGLLYRPYRHQNFCHFHNQSFIQECHHAPSFFAGIFWSFIIRVEWNPVIFIAAWRQTSLHFLAAPGNHIYSW